MIPENLYQKKIKIQDIIPPKTTRKQDEEEIEEEKTDDIKIVEEPIKSRETYQEQISEKQEEESLFFKKPSSRSKIKVRLSKKNLIIAGIVLVAIVGLIFCFSLGKAEVVIYPKTETMEFTTEINLEEGAGFIDLESNKIPAQTFRREQEKEREFPTTKEEQVEKKAGGTIIIYNKYSSESQTLVENTRFLSENGELFKTVETITVPGAKIVGGEIVPNSTNIEIKAAEPGEKYNIEATTFTIPGFKGTAKYDGFYGESTESMTGGIVGKVKVASNEDIQGAKEVLTEELKGIVNRELKEDILDELYVLEEATLVEVVESSASVESGDPVEKFKVKIKVSGKILAFNEEDAISLINSNLEENISENKTIIKDSIEINYKLNDINLSEGRARLVCEVKEDIAWKIDIDKIKQELSGKKEIDVREYLSSQPEIKSAKVIFWPFWVKKIPSDEEKIEVRLD